MFVDAAGLKARHIPYKGAGPMITDLIEGQIDFGVLAVPDVEAHLKAGTLRAVAATGATRIPSFANIPTLQEQGINATVGGWLAAIGPARLAPADEKRLIGVDGLLLQRQRVLGKPADVKHGARRHAMPHARQQYARVGGFQLAEGLGTLADLGGKAVQIGLALDCAQRRPGREGLLRGADGRMRRIGAAFANPAQQALINRAVQVKALGGCHAPAVDVVQRRDAVARNGETFGRHGLLLN